MIKQSNPKFILMPDILKNMIYIQTIKSDYKKASYYENFLMQITKKLY